MPIPLNSSGLPRGCGSLQIRRRTWWMIYSAGGNIIQANTHTSDEDEARRILAGRALERVEAQAALLREVLDERQAKRAAGGPRSSDPSAGDSRPGANRKKPAKAAGTGRTNPGQRGAGKGEAQ
jgi:hypothetical protein